MQDEDDALSSDEEEYWTPPQFASDDWRSEPPPKPKTLSVHSPAPQSILGTHFTFERVQKRQCESDREYTAAPGSEEGEFFLKWTRAALAEALALYETKPTPRDSAIPEIAQSKTLEIVSVKYSQLERVHAPELSALRPPFNDAHYHPGVYVPYENERDREARYCVNPSGAHYKLKMPHEWAHSFKLLVAGGGHAAQLSCVKRPKDCAYVERAKGPVIRIDYGVICDSAFYSSDAAIYVSKRHIVEHLSRHTAWVESESEPTTDMRALNVLFALAGDEWRSTNETLYVFRDGIWTQDESAFYELIMRHSDALGSKYGESVRKMQDVRKLALTKNRVDEKWTYGFDRLAPGLVPFRDGIYDVSTRELREIEHSDMLTSKFDFDAPTSREDVAEERAHLESILDDLFPEEQFKREVMTRLAESLFHCSNTHKYFVQLYGEGNNGKTTLLRILQTAFPQWVQMPSVEHLVARGVRNADAPQPWLIDVMGARILGFEEPPRGAKFDGSLLKLLRGNGVVTGRALYKGNVSYVPSYTLWLATNSPIEIEPTDEAVLNSIHSFKMPSCFVDEGKCAPLGTVYVRKKIPNLEARYTQRQDKLALFAVLCDYYELYKRAGLPGLESRFSKPLSSIYREEHPSAKEVFERCIVEDPSASVPAKRLFSVMQENGYEDNQKALKLFLEEQYRNHAFVKVKRPKNKLTWSGLRVLDEYE